MSERAASHAWIADCCAVKHQEHVAECVAVHREAVESELWLQMIKCKHMGAVNTEV